MNKNLTGFYACHYFLFIGKNTETRLLLSFTIYINEYKFVYGRKRKIKN